MLLCISALYCSSSPDETAAALFRQPVRPDSFASRLRIKSFVSLEPVFHQDLGQAEMA